jgi:hypothetical protein
LRSIMPKTKAIVAEFSVDREPSFNQPRSF